MASPVTYSDFDIAFLPDPVSADLQKVENDQAVLQSIRLLVLTAYYERAFRPSLGSAVTGMLFEPLDEITKTIIAKSIADAIKQFEPRATLEYIDIYSEKTSSGQKLDENSIWVEIAVKILNLPGTFSTGVLLRRLR